MPQCTDYLALKDQIAAAADARSGDHLNLLITHAAVTVLARRYTYGDVNELEIDLSTLDAGFDRIPLGHFHNFARVAPNAWYPGSTRHLRASRDLPQHDEPQVKGVLSLDTTSGTVRHHPVPGGRPLRSYRLDAFDLTAPEVYEAAAGLATLEETEGAVVRLFVNRGRARAAPPARPPPARRRRLRRRPGRDRPGRDRRGRAVRPAAAQPVTSLADEWDRYLASVPIEGYDRDRLADMGRAYLQQVEEEAPSRHDPAFPQPAQLPRLPGGRPRVPRRPDRHRCPQRVGEMSSRPHPGLRRRRRRTVPIRQFVLEQRKHTLGLRNGRIERVPVVDWMVLGERPTVEITLRNGARVEVAETHPILTDRGCVQAKDLSSGALGRRGSVDPAARAAAVDGGRGDAARAAPGRREPVDHRNHPHGRG